MFIWHLIERSLQKRHVISSHEKQRSSRSRHPFISKTNANCGTDNAAANHHRVAPHFFAINHQPFSTITLDCIAWVGAALKHRTGFLEKCIENSLQPSSANLCTGQGINLAIFPQTDEKFNVLRCSCQQLVIFGRKTWILFNVGRK